MGGLNVCQQVGFGVEKGGVAGGEGGWDVYYSLVAAASEKEVGVFLLNDEWAVDEGVDVFEELEAVRVCEAVFEGVARVAPDVFVGLGFDSLCEQGEGKRLEHGVSAGEGDVAEVLVDDSFHDVVDGHERTVVDVPALWVVASWAGVAAPGAVYGGT